jgi:hypothetical protein
MMRIDVSTSGIDNIVFGTPGTPGDGDWPRTPKVARETDAPDAVDTALRADYAAAIRKALQLADQDAAAVEAARKAIEQGALDTPQNIQTAAENLLAFGI